MVQPQTTTSLRFSSSFADSILTEAQAHQQAGRKIEAEARYRELLALPSRHAIASFGLGLLCTTQGRFREAEDAYRYTIAINPMFVDAYINLGTVLLALGRREEAVKSYHSAISVNPRSALAYANLGKALQDLGRIDEAISAHLQAIECDSCNGLAYLNYGAALLEKHAWNESIAATRQAIAFLPNNALAYANLGMALLHLGQYEEALAACHEAVVIQPEGSATYASLGGLMLELGALEEAISLCRHAIAIEPAIPTAYFNLSHALKALNRLEEAETAVRQAISLNPEAPEYHFHLAHILLLRGDMTSGWEEYEWRWKLRDFSWTDQISGINLRSQWTGQNIADKTILIFTEQGLGDIIQFSRYLPLVVQRARHVIVAAHMPVCKLLRSIEGIEVTPIWAAAHLPPFDIYCPLLSLPRVFATRLDSIPSTFPYLRADPIEVMRWRRRSIGRGLRVGIVWAGNPETQRDRFRSPGLKKVASLFSIPGVDFIVLQVGAGRLDLNTGSLPPNVLDLGCEISDLAETAAIVSGLDLMISSCTGPLHLAGALGTPTWAMIPFAPHFPWLLARVDTPWYRNMRLYRQDHPGQDWSEVTDRIARDLCALVASKANNPEPSSFH